MSMLVGSPAAPCYERKFHLHAALSIPLAYFPFTVHTTIGINYRQWVSVVYWVLMVTNNWKIMTWWGFYITEHDEYLHDLHRDMALSYLETSRLYGRRSLQNERTQPFSFYCWFMHLWLLRALFVELLCANSLDKTLSKTISRSVLAGLLCYIN